MIEVKGKANIVARVIADSVSEQGNRLTTWEVEYARLVHAELMTHRMFSRNAASSRAIPFAKMVEQLNGRPVRFGKNQAGMQDDGKDYSELVWHADMSDGKGTPEEVWEDAKWLAANMAENFKQAGYHKQITGRLTEPFQMMKTIISATETANFFWLRDDEAADPTIAELARVMKEAQEHSVPELLKDGEWHLPYIDKYLYCNGTSGYWHGIWENENTESEKIVEVTLEQAIKISCARCAAVSYRNEGYGLEKSLEVYERLLGSDKKHASAFEHVATPIKNSEYVVREGSDGKKLKSLNNSVNIPHWPQTWEHGISHVDREGNLWSGNFKGFVQYRKLIPGENYTADKNNLDND